MTSISFTNPKTFFTKKKWFGFAPYGRAIKLLGETDEHFLLGERAAIPHRNFGGGYAHRLQKGGRGSSSFSTDSLQIVGKVLFQAPLKI